MRIMEWLRRGARAALWHGWRRWRTPRHQTRQMECGQQRTMRNLGRTDRPTGKALLAYVIDPFLDGYRAERAHHINHWRASQIVNVLGELGFTVDVTDWQSTTAPPAADYDLVIGIGPAYVASCRKRKPSTRCIFLGTGPWGNTVSPAVQARCESLHKRRGVALDVSWRADDVALLASDAVFLVGNEWVRSTYAEIVGIPLYEIPNTIRDGIECTLDGKDFCGARAHFLWLAAYGAVLRGLDLLLEVFRERRDCHLWICGGVASEKQFCAAYKRELTELPNIHNMGWVDVPSSEFSAITHRCAYVLYPSAADGMPGSVVNAMAAGLIPIVTVEAGIDTGGFGRVLAQCDVASLLQVVEEAAARDAEELEREARAIVAFTNQRYSPEAFRKAFYRSVCHIMHSPSPSEGFSASVRDNE